MPARRRHGPAGGAGQGQPRRVRRELLQERPGRERRAGVGPAAVERRRDAERRAEVCRQCAGPARAPVRVRVPQGHGADEQRRGKDRRAGRGQEEVLQDQLMRRRRQSSTGLAVCELELLRVLARRARLGT